MIKIDSVKSCMPKGLYPVGEGVGGGWVRGLLWDGDFVVSVRSFPRQFTYKSSSSIGLRIDP